jgi:Sugar efflux transporter for intercellular exchange
MKQWKAWRIHSTESVPLLLTGAATANSIVWLLNGFLSSNPYQLIQNCIGVGFCSVQIALYFWIRYHPFEAGN